MTTKTTENVDRSDSTSFPLLSCEIHEVLTLKKKTKMKMMKCLKNHCYCCCDFDSCLLAYIVFFFLASASQQTLFQIRARETSPDVAADHDDELGCRHWLQKEKEMEEETPSGHTEAHAAADSRD